MSKYYFCLLSLHSITFLFSQFGINTVNPQRTLHINGGLQVTKEINLGGNANTVGDPGLTGQILKSNGPGQPAKWGSLTEMPNATGTVIAVNGKYVVAQEITINLSADFSGPASPGATIATRIGNLNDEIIDNESKYSGNATTNTFQVSEDGVYKVIMNMQISTTNNTSPVIGIWDDTTNLWVARVNDVFIAPNNGLQTYTLLTSISLYAGRNYSFRSVNTSAYTIRAYSSGTTGSGPVSEVSVKRLK
ncbi:hypothetical protein ACVVIH_02515 [Chryseobacterium arthrosphaerae]|uniref:hypothetical protein n=1 Tax=Chryseobacterium arthrosphaerae TaxID=651561 RepID=UPI003D352962